VAGVSPGVGDNATAIGQGATATGANSTALGQGAIATGANSTAVGSGASTNGFAGSTAVGAGAVSTAANQVTLGSSATTLVAPGITPAASLAAQTGPTKFFTTDATGHVASSIYGPQDIATLYGDLGGFNANVATLQQSVAGLQNQLNDVQKEERRGIAAVAGMPPILTPSAPGKFTVAVGGGFFQNQGAVGVTAAYRFDAPIPVYASASYANGGGSQNVFRIMGGVEF
jgi:autotransporter adhesin